MKHTPAAIERRRRLATTLSVASVLTAGVVLAFQLPAHSHENTDKPRTPPTGTTTGGSTQTPSLHAAIASYLKTRHGAVSVAVYDNVSKHLTVVHPNVRGRTASIVKVDILETRLHQTGGHLSEDQRENATEMIEHSDNDAATDLWNDDGGAPGVAAYDSDDGLHETTPNVDWGLTETSAADQVTLVRTLLHHNDLLTDSARKYQRTLMRHVEADQRWGISYGVPAGVTIGIKNGWLPVSEDDDRWAVNSEGWIRGDDRKYEIAVITQHDETQDYGIDTIQHIAQLAWQHATAAP